MILTDDTGKFRDKLDEDAKGWILDFHTPNNLGTDISVGFHVNGSPWEWGWGHASMVPSTRRMLWERLLIVAHSYLQG